MKQKNQCLTYFKYSFITKYFLVFSVIVSLQFSIQAAQGDLDTTFGNNGIVLTAVGNSAVAQSVVTQTDGKIVTAGYASIAGDFDFVLTRYNLDGSLDISFGTNGIVRNTIGSSLSDFAFDLVIQPDGKIIAVGQTDSPSGSSFATVRYNSDGSLDTSFGSNGIVITQLSTFSDSAQGVILQSDGKIVVVGVSAEAVFGNRFAIVRYNIDGSLDTSFNTTGITFVDFSEETDIAYDVDLQSDGKILVAGESYTNSDGKMAVARLNTNGTPDSTFGINGKVLIAFGPSLDEANAIKIQPDGKFIVAGKTESGATNSDFALTRCNPDGTTDTTFGNNGFVTTNLFTNNGDIIWDMLLQADGKIVVAGQTSFLNGNNDFALARYNTNGTLDSSFDNDGIVTTPIRTTDNAMGMAFQPGGKIVLAGSSTSGSDRDFALARYNLLDTTAASVTVKGKVLTESGQGIPRAIVTLIDSNGSSRAIMTNQFGYYQFEDVAVGESYIFQINHKQYSFTSQIIDVNEKMPDLDFVPSP